MHARSESTRPRVRREGGQRGPSLDLTAYLPVHLGVWLVCLYPEAGEAVLIALAGQLGLRISGVARRPLRTPEQVENDSCQRARRDFRRWIRANRCRYLWTFTNREAIYEWAEIERRKERFLERWNAYRAREGFAEANRVPLALVAEPHPEGHGWHLHGATDRYLPHATIEALWRYGFVRVDGPKAGRRRHSPRQLARYLSKYIAKTMVGAELHGCEARPAGAHRWWHVHGFTPTVVRKRFETLAEAIAWLRRDYGEHDDLRVFGLDDDWPVKGAWLDYDDRWPNRWRQRVKAESRAQRGQPLPATTSPP